MLGGPARSGLAELPDSKRLMPLRRDLLESFEPASLPVRCLDRYEILWGPSPGGGTKYATASRHRRNRTAQLVDGWVETLRWRRKDYDADYDEDSDEEDR